MNVLSLSLLTTPGLPLQGSCPSRCLWSPAVAVAELAGGVAVVVLAVFSTPRVFPQLATTVPSTSPSVMEERVGPGTALIHGDPMARIRVLQRWSQKVAGEAEATAGVVTLMSWAQAVTEDREEVQVRPKPFGLEGP